MKKVGKAILKAALIPAVVLLAALLEWRFELSALFRAAAIEERLELLGPLAPAAFVLVMAATVVLPVPTFPLDVLAGRLFGPVLGTLYAVTGATLGSMVSFQLARWLGRDLVSRFLRGHINFCTECSDKLLTKVVFLARLIPAVSFDVVSYGAGLTRMSLGRFAAASFLGMLPLTFAYVSFGPLLSLSTPLVWAGGLTAAALLFLLPRWIERRDPFGLRRYFEHGGETGRAPRKPGRRPSAAADGSG